MPELHPTLVDVLTNTFKVPAGELRPEATMDDLEMDSLAVAELGVIVKETLGVDADTDSAYKGATLGRITEFLNDSTAVASR
ncbi:acyl carrier protein [Streptomyces sp. NBC_01387]|uniref:acyl carrier protein n=1 Tax=unclassified Streptomyces TaxID=2593676 RepID=UPI0020249BBC|nr:MULTISPECIES: acyl carrier protein [unclassified Streptomyces]MCX4551445.1 acyl carrier protein [Streptomyces sp. NBC_01500]WSC22836.1 acyl carrier protein [Streptomyces sp. NBC_01766]WSV56748.1 acyl carrier protein [Streptomyces sp. NBC_01014]